MPIRLELRHFYGREWREVTRPRILARARHQCEKCGVFDQATVERFNGFWRIGPWRTDAGDPVRSVATRHWLNRQQLRTVHIILTVAHLNHIAGDDRDDNLKALCQYCHLNYDLGHHHETRARRKDAARPLLAPVMIPGAFESVQAMRAFLSETLGRQI